MFFESLFGIFYAFRLTCAFVILNDILDVQAVFIRRLDRMTRRLRRGPGSSFWTPAAATGPNRARDSSRPVRRKGSFARLGERIPPRRKGIIGDRPKKSNNSPGGGGGEADEEGKTLQDEIVAACQEYNVRLPGPNTAGFVNPKMGLTANFNPLVSPRAFVSCKAPIKLRHERTDGKIGIKTISVYQDGMLWLAGEGKRFGLHMFDPAVETLVKTFFHKTGRTHRPPNSINDIHVDPDGMIWIARDHGFFSLDKTRGVFEAPVSHPIPGNAVVLSLYNLGDGIILGTPLTY